MKPGIIIIALLIASFWCVKANGQTIVNGYAEVTGISGTTLTLSAIDQSNDAFVAGERAIIIQMQDDVIGANTGNNASFGDLGSIQSAGLYEIVTISDDSGLPGTLVLSSALSNTYNIGPNSSVQIITYPTLDDGGGDFTTVDDIIAMDWDGEIGGVVAFKVDGTLTLQHNISADGAGFRGGASNGDFGSAGCTPATYITTSQNNFADKGEGIYKVTDAGYAAARGKILNGGGGGNSHNGGGGGGSNYSSGGQGGPGWQGSSPFYCDPSTGGLGGLSLSAQSSSYRIFMGGGGGAGEANNGNTTTGGNGGGIILISANTLFTNTCASGGTVGITANGVTPSNSSNDGAGGAGAGGSIVLNISNYTVSGACDLLVSSDGGDGGNVTDTGIHGGGGGGGFGLAIFSIPLPISNVTVSTDPGDGGDNNDGTGSTDPNYPGPADPGGGVVGAGGGVVDNSNSPLPVELLSFVASHENGYNLLNWKTASEVNNDYFEIQLSQDGRTYATIGTVKGSGTTNELSQYQFKHLNQFYGTIYYRLKQVDYDGAYEYSKVIYLDLDGFSEPFKANIFPNPALGNIVRLQVISDQSEDVIVGVFDALGKKVNQLSISPIVQDNELNLDDLGIKNGIYFLHLNQGDHELIKKLIVR